MVRKDIWRQPPTTTTFAAGCQPLVLSTGTVVINATQTLVLDKSSPATFVPYCPEGLLPLQIFRSPSILELRSDQDDDDALGDLPPPPSLPEATNDASSGARAGLPYVEWQSPYYASTIPICITMGGATAVMWSLCIAMLSSRRRPVILKALALIACFCMVFLSAEFMKKLREQYDSGFVDGSMIVYDLDESILESVVVLIATLSLLLAELVTLMRVFPRKREQRLIFYTGFILIIVDRVLWAISEFSSSDVEYRNDSVDAVVVFSYLFSIAIAIVYACSITVYTSFKWRIAYRPNLLIMSFICHVGTFLPVILFILDLANQYLDSWSTYAKIAAEMCASLCVWVWVDRIEDYEKEQELQSVLGRQQYTEDYSPLHWVMARDPDNRDDSAKKEYDAQVKPTRSQGGESTRGDIPVGSNHRQVAEAEDEARPESGYAKWKEGWNFRDRLRFSMIKRPDTSSSTQTTYLIPPGETSGGDQFVPGTDIPLSTFESRSPADLEIYNHPFRSPSARGPDPEAH